VSPDQKAILTNIVRDETVTIKTIEYPSAAEGRFDNLKLVYTVAINGVDRTFVDWYEVEDGVVVQTREIVPAI
jgi:hypothetical protein